MKDKEIKKIEMFFYEKNDETWVRLTLTTKDGQTVTLCDTEVDSEHISVTFPDAAEERYGKN